MDARVRKLTAFLRAQNRRIVVRGEEGKEVRMMKINEWVDDYIGNCAAAGKSVTVLTQWCLSKDLEERRKLQGGQFLPLKDERDLFGEKGLPMVANEFAKLGIGIEWIITFNRSYLDSGRVSAGIEAEYKEMIEQTAAPVVNRGGLMFLGWEDDVLGGKRPQPNETVLRELDKLVAPEALAREIKRHSQWAREDAGLVQTDTELENDVCFQIACEVEEGRMLASESESPFGDFLLVPLEMPERYDFFTILASDFKKRIVAVLKPYPWRVRGGA